MQSCEENDSKNNKKIIEKFQNCQKFYGIEISAKHIELLNFKNFKINPLFVSVLWDNFSDLTFSLIKSLELKNKAYLLHLSCYQMTTERLKNIVRTTNVKNVLIIRGDLVDKEQEFKYASDMVRKLKEIKNDISIGVCGYPDIHPEAKSMEEDLKNLKFKVDSGADFIITQLCFSTDSIINFIKKCREIGIYQPVIPGVFVPTSWSNLEKMVKITKVSMETSLLKQFESYKADDERFKEFSTKTFENMIKELVFNKKSYCNGVHLFTLNSFEVAQRIVNKLF
ncbi:methylenetetrahydrofolate reductase (NADPH)-like [Condylostylus longicornis]|uniref:methylenetetrahydrofolate reductase (NADPH)-like n=1 Tax=Condylostylus longicornis TaxID=2530218 RepID=UPI00244E2DFA|nr:methylenetetrahydrofolate reductase (NADPH)-like [Condylostylus longicornis]